MKGKGIGNSAAGVKGASGRRRKDDRPKNPLRRYGPAVLAGALALLFLQGVFGPHGALAMYRTKKQVHELQRKIEKMNQENHRLADQVKSLKSDPATIERIAREEMGLARRGELVFKLQGKTNDAVSSAPGTGPPAPSNGANTQSDKTPQR